MRAAIKSHQIHLAAAEGRIEAVEALVAAGVDIEVPKPQGATPLWIAAEKGHLDVVRYLISVGADVNAVDIDNVTPIYIAAQNNHIYVIRELLEAGADVNKPKISGATPALMAAQEGHTDTLRLLWMGGANINKPMMKGISPFLAACYGGKADTAAFLCEAGCDVFQLARHKNGLQWAKQEGHMNVLASVLAAKNHRILLRKYFGVFNTWVSQLATSKPQSKKEPEGGDEKSTQNSELTDEDLDDLRGYLYKRGGTLNRWKKRYFVVSKGAYSFTIDYYKNENEAAVGSILTRHIDKVGPYRFSKKDKPPNPNFVNCGFYIRASEPKDKIYVLVAPSPEQRDAWLYMLVKARLALQRKPTLVNDGMRSDKKDQAQEEESSSSSAEEEEAVPYE